MGNKKRIRQMADIAYGVFWENDWTYGSGDDVHVPDAEEIADTIKGLKKRAEAEGLPSIESGRILVVKDDEFGSPYYEVYLNIGDLN